MTIQNLGAYIKHVHVKDSLVTNGELEYCLISEGALPTVEMIDGLRAPIEAGEVLGTMTVNLDAKNYVTASLVATRSVAARPEPLALKDIFPFLSVFELPVVKAILIAIVVLIFVLIILNMRRKARERKRKRALYERRRREYAQRQQMQRRQADPRARRTNPQPRRPRQ